VIRLSGEGGDGVYGGKSGDLRLKIRVTPHPNFKLKGRNITMVLPVAPWEAALGAKVDVNTLNGSIKLTIPPRFSNWTEAPGKRYGSTQKGNRKWRFA